MLVDRQTDRHTHHNTSHPSCVTGQQEQCIAKYAVNSRESQGNHISENDIKTLSKKEKLQSISSFDEITLPAVHTVLISGRIIPLADFFQRIIGGQKFGGER